MRIQEAKDYFHSLGSLHVDVKRSGDVPAAAAFLEGERQQPEYADALKTLLLHSSYHVIRKAVEEKNALREETADLDLSKTFAGMSRSKVNSVRYHAEQTQKAMRFTIDQSLLDLDKTDSDILILGAVLHCREANEAVLDVLTSSDENVVKLREKVEGMLFSETGALDIQHDGISLLDFYRQDFRKGKVDAQRLKKYLSFFMAFSKMEEEKAEIFFEQNKSGLQAELPFSTRHATFQADRYVYGLLFNFHSGYESRVGGIDIDKDFVSKTNHMLGQVRRFRSSIKSVLFSEDHPDAREFQDLFMQYLSSENAYEKEVAAAMLVDVYNPYELIDLYRRMSFHGQTNELIAGLSEKFFELVTNLGFESVDDLGDVVENGGLHQDQLVPKIEDFHKRLDTLSSLFTQQSDLSSLALPWHQIGLKPPTSFEISFPTGSKYVFELKLQYEDESGETFEIETQVDTKKKSFAWSLVEDPSQHEGYKNMFLALNGEVLAHFQHVMQQRIGRPIVEPKRDRLYETREKIVKEKRQPVSFSPSSQRRRAERQVSRTTIVDDDESISKHLEDVDVQDHPLIRQKIADLRAGKGRTKKLTDVKTPAGDQVHRARAGNYRIKFVEVKTDEPGVSIKIYNIKNRREAYRGH